MSIFSVLPSETAVLPQYPGHIELALLSPEYCETAFEHLCALSCPILSGSATTNSSFLSLQSKGLQQHRKELREVQTGTLEKKPETGRVSPMILSHVELSTLLFCAQSLHVAADKTKHMLTRYLSCRICLF